MKRLLLLLCFTLPLAAQNKIADHVRTNRGPILAEFVDFLKLENVATNSPKGHADIQRNAEYIVKMLEKRGIKPQILNVEGGFPAVYGELLTPGATKTVVFYAHYDGQPVDPSKWKTPPFGPTLQENPNVPDTLNRDIVPISARAVPDDFRLLYGRSASDDKAGVFGLIAALDALKATGTKASVNIKLFFEGEEEAGSEHLGAILARYADLLQSDLWILCDGPVHQSGKLQLVYGARGVMGLEMTVYGPNRALHSGHYGNWVPNPALDLAHLLASMRNSDGHIRIPGFYDDVLKPTEKEILALYSFPGVENALRKEFALGRTLVGTSDKRMTPELNATVQRSVMEPAINIRGIRAGNVGDAATNAIMTDASASIDFRLVPNQTLEKVRQRVENHLASQGYTVWQGTSVPPDELRLKSPRLIRVQWQPGYPASRTSLDSPAAHAISNVIMRVTVDKLGPAILPTLGGSVPMYLFERQFKVPVMILPIANYDNNQHAANENIRLGNLWQGIELYAALMAELGKQWK